MISAKDLFESMGSSAGSKITVGIHSNCNLSNIEVGDNFIDFIYEKDGNFNNKRAWMPDVNKLYPKEGETPLQTFARAEKEFLAHVVKHLKIFLTDNEFNVFAAQDAKQFATKAAEMLNERKSSKKVNLKLIYDTDGVFSVFGKYPDYIEEYVEGVEPTLQYSKYEMDKRMTPAAQRTDAAVIPGASSSAPLY